MEHSKALAQITAEEIIATGLLLEEAAIFRSKLQIILSEHGSSASQTWKRISKELLSPDQPFSLHQMMYYGCYKTFPDDTPPAWIPDGESASSTNIGRLLERRGLQFLGENYNDPISGFDYLQKFSVAKPEVYWKEVFEEMAICFSHQPEYILNKNCNPFGGDWLCGASLNSAELCLAINKKKKNDDNVILWREEEDVCTPTNIRTMTLKELRDKVWRSAHALEEMGQPKNSHIMIVMPMNATAIIIYLAIILAGFVAVPISDTLNRDEIRMRIELANPSAIFTQDCIFSGGEELPLYSMVVDANAPLAIVVQTRGTTISEGLREGDIFWQDFLARAASKRGVSYAAIAPSIHSHTSILFSSGTTGNPKCIPWTNATTLKAAADAWAHMDIRRGDVLAWPTNFGWMMGPWLIYASLINGASMALYNGTPLKRGFALFVQDAKVTMLGVTPSMVRTWKNADCIRFMDWSNIRCFASSGEASYVDDYLWLMGRAHYKPVIEYWGGAEIGGAFATGCLLQPQALAAFSTPAMGCKLFILGSNGNPLPRGACWSGELALHPSILGSSRSLIKDHHYDFYFRGMPMPKRQILRRHGDMIELTSGGYYRAHGRKDDILLLNKIEESSIEIERICNMVHNDILETAAVVLNHEKLIIALVLKSQNLTVDLDSLRGDFNLALHKKLNPLLVVSSVVRLHLLPRNDAGMVMRRIMRQQFLEQSNP